MKEVLSKPEGYYDLVVIEAFFGQEFLVGLGHKFKVPVVSVNSLGELADLSYFAGSTYNPAFRPHAFLDMSDHMTLSERVWNTM